MIIFALMKRLGLNSALIISTDNTYGHEMDNINYNPVALEYNMTFFQVSITPGGQTEADFARPVV